MAEIWLRPWALADADRRHRIRLDVGDLDVGQEHAGALWLYELNGERAAINGRMDAAEPVPGFSVEGEARRLLLLPFPLRTKPATRLAVGGREIHLNWPNVPERPPAKLDPQTEEEKKAHRLMLRAEAVWNRIRDLESALGDPANLWTELRRRWTEEGRNIPPSMDVIVEHANDLWRTVDQLSRAPRKILRRTHQLVPVSRVQELDRRAMTWLVRQPGETLAERAGDQQRLLAVAREENYDTLENRVLRGYCELASHAAKEYLEVNSAKRHTKRARNVEAFGRSTRRLGRHLADSGVRLAEPGVTPNFVLQHNPHYHKVWTSWKQLLDRDQVLDELWRWQAKSWEEFCALAAVVALVGIPKARLVAAAPLEFLREQSRGSWVAHDNPLATFFLPEQKIVVEVRYRMRAPGKRLADFAAPIWVRFGQAGDFTGFLNHVAIWPIWAIEGGLDHGEAQELQRVLSLGKTSNIVAGVILRPSQDAEAPRIEAATGALALPLGTQGPALWQALTELTAFFANTVMSDASK